jgi:hypothetical protein
LQLGLAIGEGDGLVSDELPGFEGELEIGRGLVAPPLIGLRPGSLVETTLGFH